MSSRTMLMAFGVLIVGVGIAVLRAQHPQMAPGMTHEQHLKQLERNAELNRRGADAMGFDQDKTAHHFRLTASGGTIEVTVLNPSDRTSLRQIREHLKRIAGEFSRGVFEKPLATHAEVPPGVPVMRRLQQAITYTYEETPAGALVRIHTANTPARRAIHDFLRYQIKEHRTGDSPVTQK